MNTQFLKSVLLAAAISIPALTQADDTDIYIANDIQRSDSEALVMFSFDVRPSTGSQGQFPAGSAPVAYFRNHPGTCSEFLLGCGVGTKNSIDDLADYLRLSLKAALKDFEGKGLKVGMMISNDSANCVGPAASCHNGGEIIYGFNPLNSDGVARQAVNDRLVAINSITSQNGSAGKHAYQFGEEMFELFRYLTGQAVMNGHGGTEFPSPATEDFNIQNGAHTTYISPLSADKACTKAYVISFANGQVNKDGETNTQIKANYASGGLNLTSLGNNEDPAEKITQAMRTVDLGNTQFPGMPDISGQQGVTSYFLYSGQAGPEVPALAVAGGTSPATDYTNADYAQNPAFVVDLLSKIFSQILSLSSTFVATAVPANVFNRAQLVDNAFIALFRPSNSGAPSWNGNLKKLKIGKVGSVTTFIDATHPTQSAINALDGRIDPSAVTFWTDASGSTGGNPPGNLKNVSDSGDSLDTVGAPTDGRQVNRGGAGQKIPGWQTGSPGLQNTDTNARQVFYDSATNALSALNATAALQGNAALQTALGTTGDTATTLSLLKYMRGLVGDGTTTPRSWIMADPLHSRPLPINYGAATIGGQTYTATNPAIFIAMAGNDGALHFMRNTNSSATSLTDTASGAQSGKEEWVFVPKAAMGIQSQLKTNSVPVAPTKPVHPYGLDGTASTYNTDTGNGTIDISGGVEKVYLFIGMRRGGKNYYGLNITNPLSPSLTWTVTGNTGSFDQLAYTFSSPKVGKVCVGTSPCTLKTALFFAGGYNTNKDYNKANPTATGINNLDDTSGTDCKGCSIYVIDASDGSLIWKATYAASTGPSGGNFTHSSLVDSIPSDVTIVDTDGNGKIDRLVVGDSGGNLWRADFPEGPASKWRLTLLAKLGRHATNSPTKADDRRFFSAPDLVQTKDMAGVSADAVLLGSGDREDPMDKATVAGVKPANYFFNVLDHHTEILSTDDSGTVGYDLSSLSANLQDLTSDCYDISGCDTSGYTYINNGWKIALNEANGEKSLSPALTFFNVVYFNTFVPPAADVTNAGIGLTCGPPEGDGLSYAISLKNAAGVYSTYNPAPYSTIADAGHQRADKLKSGGIPAQMVFLPGPTPQAIRPDLGIPDILGQTRYKGFWQRVEDVP